MRKPLTFTWKIIESFFVIIRDILLLTIYIVLHFIWYFRFPPMKKIKIMLISSDYDEWEIDLKSKIERDHIMVRVWPCDLFRIWSYKQNVMKATEYSKNYIHAVMFESRREQRYKRQRKKQTS